MLLKGFCWKMTHQEAHRELPLTGEKKGHIHISQVLLKVSQVAQNCPQL